MAPERNPNRVDPSEDDSNMVDPSEDGVAANAASGEDAENEVGATKLKGDGPNRGDGPNKIGD